MGKNEEWPKGQENGAGRNAPVANFLVPDGVLNSARSLAGPLRLGTSPDVGPRGSGGGIADSDFGLDKVRDRFDPIGTSRDRAGTYPRSIRIRRT